VKPALLADRIRRAQPCVVLTGAGVSTESGIPDFRSREGIWASYDPSEVASLDGFRRDPGRVWEFYARRLAIHAKAEPNGAHRALARLEELGLVEAVVTQNVDGLHQRAGSRNVVEVHGSIRGAVCVGCHVPASAEEVLARLPLPMCDCGEILKPGVVLFGEVLPVAALEYATALARRARLLLVVGSTLEVYPVAGLPFETLRAGGTLAIVNRGPTALDAEVELRLEGNAATILREVLAELENGR
jgi:NAD-dependent deacetylase